jgi:hypothetical protein
MDRALAGKSQDQIAQNPAKVATAEKGRYQGRNLECLQRANEVVLLASKPKEDERLQLSEAFLKSLASGGDIHATGTKWFNTIAMLRAWPAARARSG